MPNKKPGLHIPHDTGHSSFICGHNLHLFVSAILHVEISVSWHLQISHVWMHVVFADGNCKQSDFSNPLHNSWSRSSQTADKLIYIYQQRQQNISQRILHRIFIILQMFRFIPWQHLKSFSHSPGKGILLRPFSHLPEIPWAQTQLKKGAE